MIPVSNPKSSYLRPQFDIEDIISEWKSTIDSVTRNDDICVFLWRSGDIGKPEYINRIVDVIEYAKSRGMTFASLEEIAKHFRLMKNITVNVYRRDIDVIDLLFINNNNKPVNGATVIAMMPAINWGCPYKAYNGTITRIKRIGSTCRIYVATNLSAMEDKTVMIEPNITKSEFIVDLPKIPIEGKIKISVMDADRSPVSDAIVRINDVIYRTDENGAVEVDLDRGMYNVKIEKPGFKTKTFDLEVRGRIYILYKFF
ncbi:MAG: hypothetical protein DRO95_06605 [Candidatus Altiarchaeales archaeon]|nr:MAG: hypothetical protein DRO95_06605 [Candidatus Altiarchaeales archaeon]